MKYALDCSTAGTFSDARLLAELAAEAEEAGWDGFFLWDAVFARPARLPMVDPWIALAAIAMQTHRIKIGAMVTPLARRRPWQIARETASLDHLSNGRLIFGVGLGYQDLDFAAFGEDADARVRAEKLDEGLQIVAGLWAGRKVVFTGKHYHVDGVKFLPKPLQTPRIPVWVAGYWPNHRPFRRAARWDGLLPGKVSEQEFTVDDLRQCLAYVHEQRASSAPFDVAVYGFTPSGAAKAARVVRSWEQAGATWWREGIGDWLGSLGRIRARIRSGPPA